MEKLRLKNKKGFLTRDIVIAGLLFTGLIAIFVLMISGVTNNYDNTEIIDEGFSDRYDKLSVLTDSMNRSLAAVQSGEGLSFTGTFEIVFSSAFTVIKMVFNLLLLFGSVISNFVADFTFLDSEVVNLLLLIGITALTSIIVFNWISSITRGKL